MGAELVIALLPGAWLYKNTESLSARYQEYLRKQLVAGLSGDPWSVIDLAAAMRAAADKSSQPWYFPNEGHLTPQGHQFVARLVSRDFQGNSPAVTRGVVLFHVIPFSMQ